MNTFFEKVIRGPVVASRSSLAAAHTVWGSPSDRVASSRPSPSSSLSPLEARPASVSSRVMQGGYPTAFRRSRPLAAGVSANRGGALPLPGGGNLGFRGGRG